MLGPNQSQRSPAVSLRLEERNYMLSSFHLNLAKLRRRNSVFVKARITSLLKSTFCMKELPIVISSY